MIRMAAVGVALVASLLIQAWTWFEAPKPGVHQALAQALAEQIKPGDEVAWLPGWEHAYDQALVASKLMHKRRFGPYDLLRPSQRLWIMRHHSSRVLALPEGVRRQQPIQMKNHGVVLWTRSGQVEPVAWPRVGPCSMSNRRKRCSEGRASVSYGALNFDGSFAQGLTVRPGTDPLTLRFTSSGGGRLIGGIGLTGHGARHAPGPVRLKWVGNTPQGLPTTLPSSPGLVELDIEFKAGQSVELVFEGQSNRKVEVGLSVGWWKP